MKLTKNMFDFEKYDYRFGYPSIKDEALFSGGSQWVSPDNNSHQGLLRTPKPKPRYILLEEGEKLQAGDQEGYWDSGAGVCWYKPIQHGGTHRETVPPGEIWRRKVPQ